MSSPFDEAKYEALLKGPQISEILLSDLENQMTIGAEYYAPEYLETIQVLRKSQLELRYLPQCCSLITDGDHGSADYQDEGVPFILSESVKEGWIDSNSFRYISERYNSSLPRSELSPGDVLLTKTGVYFGKSAVMPESIPKANTIAHVAKIVVKSSVNPYYLSTFFNSHFGYSQSRRRGIKATRPEIKLVEFADMIIGLPSINFQSAIERQVRSGLRTRQQMRALYNDTETLLLRILGLEKWKPSTINKYQVSFTDVWNMERFDANFFHPRYKDLELHLKTRFHTQLRDIADVSSGFPWKSEYFIESVDQGEPFVRIRDCKPGQIDTESLSRLDSEYAHSCRLNNQPVPKAQYGDIIIGMDGVDYFYGGLIKIPCYVNQRACRVSPHSGGIPSEYLMVAINSIIGQSQLLQSMTTAHTVGHITNENVRNLTIPLLDEGAMEEIAQKVRDSFYAKTRGEALLERAKRAVEVAIEKDETAGLAILEEREQ